mgnify:CR=1 FL=1
MSGGGAVKAEGKLDGERWTDDPEVEVGCRDQRGEEVASDTHQPEPLLVRMLAAATVLLTSATGTLAATPEEVAAICAEAASRYQNQIGSARQAAPQPVAMYKRTFCPRHLVVKQGAVVAGQLPARIFRAADRPERLQGLLHRADDDFIHARRIPDHSRIGNVGPPQHGDQSRRIPRPVQAFAGKHPHHDRRSRAGRCDLLGQRPLFQKRDLDRAVHPEPGYFGRDPFCCLA